MTPEFQSLFCLYLKEWILMGVCAIAAVGFVDTRPLLLGGQGRGIATLCVSLPLGMAGLLLTGYLSLRLMLLIGFQRPVAASAGMSAAVALLGIVLFIRRVVCRWHSSPKGVGRATRHAVEALL